MIDSIYNILGEHIYVQLYKNIDFDFTTDLKQNFDEEIYFKSRHFFVGPPENSQYEVISSPNEEE
jgi:hypothetical protein